MNKKLLLISISSILILALLVFFVVASWNFFVGEKVLSPIAKDAEKTCSEQNGIVCSSSQTCSGSWLDASDSGMCCDGECGEENEIDYEDSPFGFHTGSANNYAYIQDMGAVWSREGTYIIWDWVDVERNGNFKFTNATAPPKEGVPSSGGQVNYDALRLNTPEDINIMTNVCPFRQGGSFTDSIEPEIYQEFVEKMVERYDGDDNLGCVLTTPDCYNLGDNDYPSKEIIEKFEINPIKYWQVCNQVTDVCDEKNCRETYAEKYAEVQKITYQAIKEADKTAGVLIAGDSSKELYPKVFGYLNGDYVDIIDFHRFGTKDNYDPENDFDYLKTSLQNAGFDLDKLRFWITETGTYSGDPSQHVTGKQELLYQSEKQQASGLLKRYVSALSYKIEKIFWAWNIVEGFKRDCGIFDYTGLVYDGCDCNENGKYVCEKGVGYDLGQGVKKLSYYTYKLMVEKLEGSDWDNIQTIQKSDGVYVYKFTKNGEHVWVAWDDAEFQCIKAPCGRQVTISGISSSRVKITEAVPGAESGEDLNENDYPNFFKTDTQTVSGGKVEIILGESPVFVEEK
ncbi:hypothetical protein KKF38_00235 [Patescibacteria group bacterium]|nr:hypothetical protein [Patescibacteria group bacterium]